MTKVIKEETRTRVITRGIQGLPGSGEGGGVTDHGALTGLSDDDHTQYHNNTRGDARYYTKTLLDAGQLDSRYYTEAEVDTALSGKANTSHTHAISDVTGLQTALDGKAASSHTHAASDVTSGTFSDARVSQSNVTQHQAAIDHGSIAGLGDDDHTQYHTDARGDARYYTKTLLDAGQLDSRYYTETEVNTALSGKANTIHTHAVSDVTGLQTALDGKAASSHTHEASQITDFAEAVQDQIGGSLVEGDNITISYNDSTGETTISASVSGGGGGDMQASTYDPAEKEEQVLTVSDLLDEDNFASNSATKVPSQQSTKTYVDSGLSGKANSSHSHATSDITSGTFADARIAQSSVTQHQAAIDHGSIAGLADDDHTQYHTDTRGDARYYTKTLLDGGQLDNRYYTETEVDSSLSGKANSSHTHAISDVTGLQTALDGKAASSHSHAAGDVTSGTFADARIAQSNVTQHQAAIDHGSIAGLADDDHTQYHTDTRGDARYYTKTLLDGGQLDNRYYTETEVDSSLSGKANSSHTHVISDVTGLQTALDGKAASSHTHAASDVTSGTFADARISQSSVTQHQAAIDHGSIAGLADDDHTQYHNNTRGDARYYTKTNLQTSGQASVHYANLTNNIINVHGSDIASASTVNLDTATGDLVDVTGTTTITAITLSEGGGRVVRFTGALTLTHGSSLVLPGAANITTAAGDFALFRGYAAGVVRCVLYQKAAGVMLTAANIGVTVQAYDANTVKSNATRALSAGYSATVYDAGTKSTGTFTPDEANGAMQKAINGGAHTFAPPTNSTTLIVKYTNNGSAGTITTSGFTKVTGDTLTTTNGHVFLCYITKHESHSHLQVVALQ